MTSRPFHHGNLRAVLLERAEAMLRDRGIDALSLRELAREAGVSHGAPRSHFVDRQALLDALAVRGFERMTEGVEVAVRGDGSLEDRFRRVGRAYVDFAVEDAALMELMFASKSGDPGGAVPTAAGRLFQVLDDAVGASAPDGVDDEDRERFKLLFAAAMQGIATLTAAHRVTREQMVRLLDDAVDVLLDSALGRRVVLRD